jgi:RNA polymerase subunit RPABC4/transcription elongation factor Spt4
MKEWICENCYLVFLSEEPVSCPRCSSKKIRLKRKDEEEEKTQIKELKAGACTNCGGTDFILDWKKREKICKKCGNIMPLVRMH